VILTVAECNPVTRGQTAAPSFKSAVMDNGIRVLVPPFIDVGTKIIVSTEDGVYVRRAE
jgi:elongation factor P